MDEVLVRSSCRHGEILMRHCVEFLLRHDDEWLCADLDYVVEDVQVLLHTVVQPQVGDEVAGEHAVQPVEEAVHAGVQVHQVRLVDRTWRGRGLTMSINTITSTPRGPTG